MDPQSTLTVAAAIAMGLGLAACAGLRAFLPLLALSVAARTGWMSLAPELRWLESNSALILLSSAVFFEVLGDKIPAVDNMLDAVGVVARPVAGGFAAVVPFLSAGPEGSMIRTLGDGPWGEAGPWIAAGTGVLAGASVTALVQLAKAVLRLGSTSLTLGLGNPVISLVEDGVSTVGVVLALLLPLLALALAAFGVALAAVWLRRRRQRDAPVMG